MIPKLIESELDVSDVSGINLKIIEVLKGKIDENWKKIEGLLIQAILVQVRSELSIGFVSYFYSDLLDNEVDFYYKEKINPDEYTGKLNR